MASVLVPTLEKPLGTLYKSIFIVSTIINRRFLAINNTALLQVPCPMNDLLPSITLLHMCHFFLFLCYIFIAHFLWAFRSLHEPLEVFLFWAFICLPITHSFLGSFQRNWYQHFSHVTLPIILFSA